MNYVPESFSSHSPWYLMFPYWGLKNESGRIQLIIQ